MNKEERILEMINAIISSITKKIIVEIKDALCGESFFSEEERKDFVKALAELANIDSVKVSEEEKKTSSNYQTGVPTEEGWYVIQIKLSCDPLNPSFRLIHIFDEQGYYAWERRIEDEYFSENMWVEFIDWQKIEPRKESK